MTDRYHVNRAVDKSCFYIFDALWPEKNEAHNQCITSRHEATLQHACDAMNEKEGMVNEPKRFELKVVE